MQPGAQREIARYGVAVLVVLAALAVASLVRPFDLEGFVVASAAAVVAGLAVLIAARADMRHRAERSLAEARDALDRKVSERSVELERANQQLRDEIAERKKIEAELRRKEAFLTEVRRASPRWESSRRRSLTR